MKIPCCVKGIVFSLLFLFAFPQLLISKTVSIEGMEFFLNETDKTATLSNLANVSATDVKIPRQINVSGQNFYVTTISRNAFAFAEQLRSVTIPNLVTAIDGDIFEKNINLMQIIVEEGNPLYDSRENCNAIIQTDNNYLLLGCNGTVIPKSVTHIMDRAFFNRVNLSGVVIHDFVKYIGVSAFEGCRGLKSVKLGKSISAIPFNAFKDCKSLESITIPKACVRIDDGSFDNCENLNYISVENGNPVYNSRENCNAVLKGESLVVGSNNTVIPEGLFFIEHNSFRGRKGLKSIVIPNSVTYIVSNAFYQCTLLSDVKMSESLVMIGEEAFYECCSLKEIRIPDKVERIQPRAFAFCTGATSLYLGKSYVGEIDFLGCCPNISSVVVSSENSRYDSRNNCNAIVETKPNKLVQGWDNTVIPNSIQTVGMGAFRSLNKEEVYIPNSVTRLESSSFEFSNIRKITLDSSVKWIGERSFYGCTKLKEIVSLNAIPPYFEKDPGFTAEQFTDVLLYVPIGKTDVYKDSPIWGNFWNIKEIDLGGVGVVGSCDILVSAKDGVIEVYGAEGEIVEIYSVAGELIYRGCDTHIIVPSKGIFIVRISGKVYKVLV